MKPNVLVIEDDFINIELIREMLFRFDCEVVVAENGKDGVKEASENRFDLILLDLHMPEMDGISAAKKMRANGVGTPIVALTANVVSGIKSDCIAAGMNDFMSKPIELKDVEAVLKKYVKAR
jgi:CheY-like chemotaxis protein